MWLSSSAKVARDALPFRAVGEGPELAGGGELDRSGREGVVKTLSE
jgi:hypothetical protein